MNSIAAFKRKGEASLSYDGKGINNRGEEYSPRVATFTSPEYAERFGPLFEAAPELLDAARRAYLNLLSIESRNEHQQKALDELGAAISKAEG